MRRFLDHQKTGWITSRKVLTSPFVLYYGHDNLMDLVEVLANAYPDHFLFFWEKDKKSDLSWVGSDTYSWFGAPYRPGAVRGSVWGDNLGSPAIKNTVMLGPGMYELVTPCTVCKWSSYMHIGKCSLFSLECEKRGDDRWKEP